MAQETTLCVWDLDTQMEEPELFRFIEEGKSVGSLRTVQILRDARNRSLGRGIVVFRDRRDAEKTILNLSSLLVSDSRPPKMAIDSFPPFVLNDDTQSNDEVVHDVCVGNLSVATTVETLIAEFRSYGIVLHARIYKKAEDEVYGFVKYQDPEHRFAAIASLNGKFVDGKAWRVNQAHKKENQGRIKEAMDDGRVLYASNLRYEMKDGDLEQLFCGFGSIVACHIRKHSDGRSRGDGFVEYSTNDAVLRAIRAMDRKMICGRRIYLGVGKSSNG